VGPVLVVVADVVDDEALFELSLVPDDGAVEEFSADWLPRCRTSARASVGWPSWRRNRLRAAWVVQAPVGFAVTPPKNTCRVGTSMKNGT
jgi:hypothetical protein